MIKQKTIFDAIEDDEEPRGQKGFFQAAKKMPDEPISTPPNKPSPSPSNEDEYDNYFLSRAKDYGKTALKGTIEGVTKLGRAFGPLQSPSEDDEGFTEKLNELLPTDEGFLQRGLRRGLREAPTMLAFPGASTGQTIARTAIAGYAGQTAEELGLPEWAQGAAELTAFIGPDLTKKLLTEGKHKDIISFAKKKGMTDEQIAPLLNSDFKKKWLSKLVYRRGATAEALKNTKSAISDVYSGIQNSPIAQNVVGRDPATKMFKDMAKIIEDMPAGVRDIIKKDAEDLVKRPITGDRLINFYADINHYLGPDTKQLSLLKEPIKKALGSISPELEKEFGMVNDLFVKYFDVSSKLKPNLVSDIVSAAETVGILSSMVTGYYPGIASIIGEQAGKKLAQQLMINPRLQQLSKKMGVAINENKFRLAKNLVDQYADVLEKSSPETSEKLKQMTDEELKEFLKLTRPKETEEEGMFQKIRLK